MNMRDVNLCVWETVRFYKQVYSVITDETKDKLLQDCSENILKVACLRGLESDASIIFIAFKELLL